MKSGAEQGERVGRGEGGPGGWQGPALGGHFGAFASRAVGSHRRVFEAGCGVTRLGSNGESGGEGSKADLKMVVRWPWQWLGDKVTLVSV